MKKEEKIEVMFESILLEMEKISKSISNNKFEDVINESVIEESSTDQIFDQLEGINKRLDRLNIKKDNLGSIDAKLHDIKWRIENAEHIPKSKSESFHYIWFFPDLKGWLTLINKGKVAWISVVLLLLSMGLNYYMGKDYFFLKGQNSKYKYLKYSHYDIPLSELDSLWEIERYRERILNYVSEVEAAVESENSDSTQTNKKVIR
ncbi:MAG: hypothetical protein ACFHWX_07830 [Bacteroidota bacterium]